MTSEVAKKIEGHFAKYKTRKYSKGQILIYPGDKTGAVFHLLSGTVKQYDISYRGDEVILNIFKPPAFFPMSLAISEQPSKFFFEANTDIEVHQAPNDETIAFLKANSDVLFDLLTRVYIGTEGMLGRMSQLMTSSAKSRLIYEILLESRRFGTTGIDGVVTLEISEKDLGARSGLTRETVNREIRKLKAEKLIAIHRNGIAIPDIAKLETRLGKEI
jgi:CRP-like cAMP-binding protein